MRKKVFFWKHFRIIAIVTVNILLFFIFAELIALGFYFFRDGTLFYTDKSKAQVDAISENANQELASYRLHPFLGVIPKPNSGEGDWKFNNYGFHSSSYDYPFTKTRDNQYIIGVFGGSVAAQFVLESEQRFIFNLKQYEYFKDKEIIVLVFAHGGFKQPGQLQILTYFLSLGQEFDMVINIDGFNEVALSYDGVKNYGIDIAMPYAERTLSLINLIDQTTLTPEKINSLANINNYKLNLNSLADRMTNSHWASTYFLWEQYYKITLANYEQEVIHFSQLDSNSSDTSLIFINKEKKDLATSTLFEQIAENWANSSIVMHQILSSRKIPYYHFLQPNQYYTNRPFDDEEAQIALTGGLPEYKIGVELGYPELINKSKELIQNQVKYYSALDIFDDEKKIVYGDNCCHYSPLGNEMLVDYVSNIILTDLSQGDFTELAKPELLDNTSEQSAIFLPAFSRLEVGMSVPVTPEEEVILKPDDLVLTGKRLWRIEADHTMPLSGIEGQSIQVKNLGAWDQEYQTYTGLPVVFQNGDWIVDNSAMIPSNENYNFNAGTEQDPIPGWQVSPADASYELTRMRDETGPFVRILATEDTPYLVVNGYAPLNTLDGVPVSLHAQMRTNSKGWQVLTLADTIAPGEVQPYTTGPETYNFEEWNTFIIPGAIIVWPDPGDNYSIGLSDVKAGDWFDVRELSVYLGRMQN